MQPADWQKKTDKIIYKLAHERGHVDDEEITFLIDNIRAFMHFSRKEQNVSGMKERRYSSAGRATDL